MTKPKRPFLFDTPLFPKMMRAWSRFNVWIYRKTDGRLGSNIIGLPIMLLTTKGRKSGEPRTAPLLYLHDGERVIIVASQGGLPDHPLWYLNLEANPECEVQIGARVRKMRARTAEGEERSALWKKLVKLYPDFENYQSWAERVIPVVVLEPR